jgi:hypothetical protein
VERAQLLLASAKILVIGHADLLAIGSIALDPVVSPAIRYVDHVVCYKPLFSFLDDEPGP